MRAADLGRVLELPRAALQDLGQPLQVLGDDGRGLSDEQCLRGVDHIVRRESVVEPARVRTHDLGHRRGESDDVMADFRLDFLDPLQPEAGALADGLGRLPGDHAGLGQGLGGRDFHRQPGLKPVFVAPDAPHLGASVTRNHGDLRASKLGNAGL